MNDNEKNCSNCNLFEFKPSLTTCSICRRNWDYTDNWRKQISNNEKNNKIETKIFSPEKDIKVFREVLALIADTDMTGQQCRDAAKMALDSIEKGK